MRRSIDGITRRLTGCGVGVVEPGDDRANALPAACESIARMRPAASLWSVVTAWS